MTASFPFLNCVDQAALRRAAHAAAPTPATAASQTLSLLLLIGASQSLTSAPVGNLVRAASAPRVHLAPSSPRTKASAHPVGRKSRSSTPTPACSLVTMLASVPKRCSPPPCLLPTISIDVPAFRALSALPKRTKKQPSHSQARTPSRRSTPSSARVRMMDAAPLSRASLPSFPGTARCVF